MPTSEELNILGMMLENAALCHLEAEVIMALKAYEVGDNVLFQQAVGQVIKCLQRIDDVRRRNDEATQSQALRED
jgi:hypothetical protein